MVEINVSLYVALKMLDVLCEKWYDDFRE